MTTSAKKSARKPAVTELQRRLESAAAALSREDERPRADGRWNGNQILEHLYLTYTGTIKGFGRVVQEGKPLARRPVLMDRFRAFAVTGLGYLPEGRKSPPVATPKGADPATVRAQIGIQLVAMDDLLTQCEQKFGSRALLLDHPVLGPLTANQWRKFHLVHGRHHLKQLERRRAEPNS